MLQTLKLMLGSLCVQETSKHSNLSLKNSWDQIMVNFINVVFFGHCLQKAETSPKKQAYFSKTEWMNWSYIVSNLL